MRRLRAGWIGAVVIFVVLAGSGLMAWLAIYLRSRGLDWDAKLSEIVSAGMVVGAAVLAGAGRIAHWLPAPRLKDEQVEADVADLAAALRVQGRFDGVLSGLYIYDRLPMPVRWQPAHQLSPGLGLTAPDAENAEAGAGAFDEVLEFFRQQPESRLVVLGNAGGGKTVLVTELARRLLASRKADDPVPVIIPVAAWDPRQTSLFDWVSVQLVRINADLAKRVSDGHRYITRAQALVDRMKVLPILDGLDEVAKAGRPMATLAINRYGWTQPLVVTCRTEEYLQITTMERGTPIARAAAVTLQPLELADVKGYLGPDPDGHWASLYDRLNAEPRGPLAIALGNPLMLWLTWAVYSGDDRSPEELEDRRRFDSVAAIEHHLLAEFVPAAYADSKDHRSRLTAQLMLPAPQRRRRWLGFLAADKYLHSKWTVSGEAAVDLFETRDVQNVAWWRFAPARGYRIASTAVRGALIWVVIWQLLLFELRRHGNWRHGSYAGPIHFRAIFLSGYVGRTIWPTVDHLINIAPMMSRRHAFSSIRSFLAAALNSHLSVTLLILIAATFLILVLVAASASAGRPQHLHIAPRQVVAFLERILRNLVVLAGIAWLVLAIWHRTNQASVFFGMRSTWYTIVVVGLVLSLPGLPRTLVARTDVVGAVTAIESLRSDRWADIVVTTTRRAIFASAVLLLSGTQLALAYLVFAASSTFVGVLLGGGALSSFASRSYLDACIWLGLTGQMPWRPMRFLVDAERRGIFQEIGAVFRFRHARVQLELRYWYEDYSPGVRNWLAWYLRLADRLRAYAGNRATTLTGARERVESYRTLADRNLAEFGNDLAEALSGMATLLREQGYREQELDALAQLVATRRQLAELDAADIARLANSLQYFAARLSDTGRDHEALDTMTEAAAICGQLAMAGREGYLASVERCLYWLKLTGEAHGRLNRGRARAVKEVLDSCVRQVRAEPGVDRESYATSLIRLAGLLQRLQRDEDAADAINEAAQIYVELAQSGPPAARAARASALIQLASQLAELHHAENAAGALACSVDIYRDLALLEPAEYRPWLVASLYRVAAQCREMGRPDELGFIHEAVSEYRAVAAANMRSGPDRVTAAAEPEASLSDTDAHAGLSLTVLSYLTLRLWQLGAQDEAIEAADIGRRLAEAIRPDPQQELPADMRSLIWDMPLGLPSDRTEGPSRWEIGYAALWLRILSLARREDISDLDMERARDLTSLVKFHDEQAFRLLLAGRADEFWTEAIRAAECCYELVRTYRRLADTRPAHNLRGLADSLDLLARQRRKARYGEAEADAAASEAILIRRRLGLAPTNRITGPCAEQPTFEPPGDLTAHRSQPR